MTELYKSKLVEIGDPILKEACKVFDFEHPPIDPIELQEIFKRHLIGKNTLGLSANQIGIPYRVFAIQDYEEKNVGMIFNPNIVNMSTETSKRCAVLPCDAFQDIYCGQKKCIMVFLFSFPQPTNVVLNQGQFGPNENSSFVYFHFHLIEKTKGINQLEFVFCL